MGFLIEGKERVLCTWFGALAIWSELEFIAFHVVELPFIFDIHAYELSAAFGAQGEVGEVLVFDHFVYRLIQYIFHSSAPLGLE